MTENSPLLDVVLRDEYALLSCAEMAKADAAAIAGGAYGTELMEAAGRAVVAAISDHYRPQPVIVICGPGNNGGDGFVVARLLKSAGWSVRVALMGTPDQLKGDAAWAARLWKGPMGDLATTSLAGRPLIVDALFGAGLNRAIEGAAAGLIGRVNAERLTVVSVDIPSGVNGDTGEIMGTAFTATLTVTFFRAKLGHYSAEGLRRCGSLRVADIGIPSKVLDAVVPRAWRNDPVLWSALLRRAGAEHKYARGHLTILGGAQATGAARLAAISARRVGAGLATIASPREAMAIYQMAEAGNLVTEADDYQAFTHLLADERRNAFVIGPGAGVNDRTRGSVLAALASRRAVVLDADAITAFADQPAALFKSIAGPALMTPHEGEFRRLFPDLAALPSKVERAKQAAQRSNATVLLKGPDTVLAAPDGRALINGHATSGLATAGSGDVLAGMAGGLMAQGLAPMAAGAAAAWLHGEAAYRFRRPGLIAEDLPGLIPEALERAIAPPSAETK
ncbi:MAG: NAD(P)H-hydrate dehydratase [Proteobacteria bacterium]|nr:NAD(P)H-hydrate dehydratase [Pseudomonadota bacterium]